MNRLSLLFSVILLPGFLAAQTTLIEEGHTGWKYDEGVKDPGQEWAQPTFDDSGWKTGTAPLGYGEPDIKTTLSFGQDSEAKHPVAYFRLHFRVPENAAELWGGIRCDDGAAIYLNGREWGRFNLGSDPITHRTLARRQRSAPEESTFQRLKFPLKDLKPGEDHLIAISIHQGSARSSDLALDFELRALSQDQLPRIASLPPSARKAVDAYHKRHRVGPDIIIPNGYVDGGTYMKIKEDGTIAATREVITVDRERDERLNEHLAYARTTRDLPAVERARTLARFIDQLHSPNGDREKAEIATAKLQDFKNREILLGDIPAYCGGGVCRHRSLLFKLLGDEADLQVSLVRGLILQKGRAIGRHAWNEILLDDGSLRIVDVMNPEKDFKLPSPEKVGFNYGDIKGQPLYRKPRKKSNDKKQPIEDKKEAA
ncbi:MAG: EDR1-related protein [Verrucomicrobiota bacterium]